MVEQAGGRSGDALRDSGGRRGKPRRLARRPRAWFAATFQGGFGNPPWGYYGPCARSSLTARPIHRDTQARAGAAASLKSDAGSRKWSAARRARLANARRASQAWLDLVRLAALRSPPSPCGLGRASPASAKPGYSGLARRSISEGGRRSVGCLTIESENERSARPDAPIRQPPAPSTGSTSPCCTTPAYAGSCPCSGCSCG